MISMRNVSREYRLDGGVITPVRDVSLEITPGEFVLLIGRSGSGKTSLLNLAGGLLRPTRGEVFIKGTDIWTLTDRQLAGLRAAVIGFVFQFPNLIPTLTVMENTLLPISFNTKGKKSEAYNKAVRWLEKLGMEKRLRSFPGQLSAGEQKRAVLARALMNDPEILLADEPTSDLDEQTEHEIMSVLNDLNAGGLTIFMVTHSSELIPQASRALRLEEGKLVGFAPA